VFYIEDFGRKDNTELTEEDVEMYTLGGHQSFPTASQYRNILTDVGFEIESMEDHSKEWSQFVFNRSNNHIANQETLR